MSDEPTEFPCFMCGDWYAASELIEYRNYTPGVVEEDEDGRKKVHENMLFCPDCDRKVQNEYREFLLGTSYDPDQLKDRFE